MLSSSKIDPNNNVNDVDEEVSDYSTSNGATSATEDEIAREKFTQQESKNILYLRVLVIIVIFLAAVAVSLVVFFLSKNSEKEEYEMMFDGAAEKLLHTGAAIVTDKLAAVNALATALTALSIDRQHNWPFVTMSSFQERATEIRQQSGTFFVSIVPIVSTEQREEYEDFTKEDEEAWIQDGIDFQEEWDSLKLGVSLPRDPESVHPGYIFQDDFYLGRIRDDGYGPYFPIWQTSPLLKGMVNFNMGSIPEWLIGLERVRDYGTISIGRMLSPPPGDAVDGNFLTRFFASMLSIDTGRDTRYQGDPFSFVFVPIFDSHDDLTKRVVGALFAVVNWAAYLENVLPDSFQKAGVTLVLSNECDTPYTYTIKGNKVILTGSGDLHDTKFDSMKQTISLANLPNTTQSEGYNQAKSFKLDVDKCPYTLSVYPSQSFYDHFNTNSPILITGIVGAIFIFTVVLFIVYDRLVERRQQLLLAKAVQSTTVLASLFPKSIRDQLMQEAAQHDRDKKKKDHDFVVPKNRLTSFLNGDDNEDHRSQKPLAEMFPFATVFFADIAGFTAWSSTRDPAAVFILLQNLYQSFDVLAKARGVFKIETIGDSYVAVTGVPQRQDQHAVIMARFSMECMAKVSQVTSDLTLTLGPDTAALKMRIGIHSGPVTAGVLRGDRARFQLFGDTVNTAARMEATGIPGKIQVSESTAEILISSGKGHWVTRRIDAVHAKGKGVLNTYWLSVHIRKATSSGGVSDASGSTTSCEVDAVKQAAEEKKRNDARLVDWIAEILKDYLKQVVAQQRLKNGVLPANESQDFVFHKTGSNLDEVAEIISLPTFDEQVVSKTYRDSEVTIDPLVIEQLRTYVATVAELYRDNPFHNFSHACHVVMSTQKFLQRIVTPDIEGVDLEQANRTGNLASELYMYTHGITDPLTLFGILFSALVHDVDHRGCSNMQLAKEDETMAAYYQNKSLAEQNSLDLSWELFMSPTYRDLRQCLFADEQCMLRFRQVVLNTVLATDIFDEELNALRKARWNKAFNVNCANQGGEGADAIDYHGLQATIVIEHIIQASDVAHTMQHWHIYRKFNECLFKEMYLAYQQGRMGADPSAFWYKGELGFFDNYICPLARKLKDCKVFGVNSDECLNYALRNRAEWEERGQAIVAEMMEELNPQSAQRDASGGTASTDGETAEE